MKFLKEKKADLSLEYILVGGIIALVLGAGIYGLADNTSTEGSNLGSWIEGIGVPGVP